MAINISRQPISFLIALTLLSPTKLEDMAIVLFIRSFVCRITKKGVDR